MYAVKIYFMLNLMVLIQYHNFWFFFYINLVKLEIVDLKLTILRDNGIRAVPTMKLPCSFYPCHISKTPCIETTPPCHHFLMWVPLESLAIVFFPRPLPYHLSSSPSLSSRLVPRQSSGMAGSSLQEGIQSSGRQ